MDPDRAAANPPLDISPPPPQQYELRVICWSAKDIPEDARDDSGLGDFSIKLKFGSDPLSPWEETDTHLRAVDGVASWNWRFVLPIHIDEEIKSEHLRLYVQLWDKDLLSSNDHIGDATIPLARWLKQTFMRRHLATASGSGVPLVPTYWNVTQNLFSDEWPPAEAEDTDGKPIAADAKSKFQSLQELALSVAEKQPLLEVEDPELEAAKFWLPVVGYRRDGWNQVVRSKPKKLQGQIMLSMQLVPVETVERLPAGKGRSEPNLNPILPKPVGRLQFSLNPFVMLYRLIGRKYCHRLACICCCFFCTALAVVIGYFLFPVVFGNLVTAPLLGRR